MAGPAIETTFFRVWGDRMSLESFIRTVEKEVTRQDSLLNRASEAFQHDTMDALYAARQALKELNGEPVLR